MRINKLLTIIWQGLMGLLVVLGIIFAGVIHGPVEEIGIAFMIFGLILVLLTSFSWARIIEEYGYSHRKEMFLKVIHYILGGLGLAILSFVGFFALVMYIQNDTTDTMDSLTQIFYGGFFAIIVALIFNALLRNFPSLFPSARERWPRLFFEDYGFMILLPVCLIGTIFLLTFGKPIVLYVLILIWNFVAIFFFLFLKCRYNKVILGYILIGLTALIDVFIMIFTSSEIEGFGTLVKSNGLIMFQFTCAAYFLIALIICIPFYALVEKFHNKLSRNVRSIIFFVVPFVSFGLQILMYFYWYIALIIALICIGIAYLIALFTPCPYTDYLYQDSDGDYYIVRRWH